MDFIVTPYGKNDNLLILENLERKMQKQKCLQFCCPDCQQSIGFSLSEIEKKESLIICSKCKKKYLFSDDNLIRQLNKFAALCKQLQESEEILSETAIGIDIGESHVKIPYKILLTRLNTVLDLMIGNQPVSFSFRFEPLHDS